MSDDTSGEKKQSGKWRYNRTHVCRRCLRMNGKRKIMIIIVINGKWRRLSYYVLAE